MTGLIRTAGIVIIIEDVTCLVFNNKQTAQKQTKTVNVRRPVGSIVATLEACN